jgi:hypothetical protein
MRRKSFRDVQTFSLARRGRILRTNNEAPRPAPPPPRFARYASSSGPPPPLRGGGWSECSRSRDAPAPEFCQAIAKNERQNTDLRRKAPAVDPAAVTIMLCKTKLSASQEINKGSGTPKNADPYSPHLAMRLAPCKARSPSGVPPRLSPKGIIPSQRLGFRPGFLGRGLYGRYPPSPVPVQGCTSRPGHRAGGLMPKPPGSSSDEPPPAGTALAPTNRGHQLTSFT